MITRFAPSPTGRLHIGGIRTALYCYLLAKKNEDGSFILRIEDTDQARSTKLFEKNMIDSMSRVGLHRNAGPGKNNDKGPYYQMERLPIYEKYTQELLESGCAYYARESSEELDEMRELAKKEKRAFHYRQREYSEEQLENFKAEGRKPVIRFKITPSETIQFTDAVKGEMSFGMKEFSDFVIVKGDGIPTYNFANVIDDTLHGITHVIRGEEHLTNTPKQIVIYNALKRSPPTFAHLPLLLNPHTGKKLSKRDDIEQVGFILVDQFIEGGFLPEALINFVALLGWNPGTEKEFFTMDELVQEFSLSRVQPSNALYDFNRALRFNSEWIKRMNDELFVQKVKDFLYLYGDEERKEICEATPLSYRLTLASYIKVRIQTLDQFRTYCKYFFYRPEYIDTQLVYKEKMKATQEVVQSFGPDIISLLDHLEPAQWTEETIKSELISFISSKELKNGQVLRPVRAILTGVQASPGAFEMLTILGKEESLVRLRSFFEENE